MLLYMPFIPKFIIFEQANVRNRLLSMTVDATDSLYKIITEQLGMMHRKSADHSMAEIWLAF